MKKQLEQLDLESLKRKFDDKELKKIKILSNMIVIKSVNEQLERIRIADEEKQESKKLEEMLELEKTI